VLGTAAFPIDLPPAPKLATGVAVAPAPGRATSGPAGAHTAKSATAGTPRGSGQPRTVLLIVTTTVAVPVLLVLVVPVFVRRRQRKRGPYAVDAGGALIGVPESLLPATLAPAGEPGGIRSGATAETGESPSSVAATAGPGNAKAAAALANETAGSQIRSAPSFRVLGEVEAADLELPTTRLVVVELLVFLACMKTRRFTPDEITAELWPLGEDGAETVSRTSFQKYMTYARRAAGLAAFPKAVAGRLSIGNDVTTDWEVFKALVERAKTAEANDGIDLLVTALGLVRGPAFSGVPKGRYAWAGRGLITEIDVAVIAAAERLAELCLEAGVAARALEGTGRALRATKDPRVGDDLLSLAGATGDLGTLERAWRDVEAIVGTEAAGRLRRSYEAIRRRLVEADELVG
jgi:hypothetical protein